MSGSCSDHMARSFIVHSWDVSAVILLVLGDASFLSATAPTTGVSEGLSR